MEKQNLKMKIIRSAIQRHNTVMDQYHDRIRKLRSLELTKDRRFGSRPVNAAEMLRLLQNHLLFLNEDANVLYNIHNISTAGNYVKPGSVVVTDRGIFFISIFVDSFKEDGKEISCVSENCPLYFQIEGRSCGDSFTYEGIEHRIIEIY